MFQTFHIPKEITKKAIKAGDDAQQMFHQTLKREGQTVLDTVTKSNGYAVVLASRPYQRFLGKP